MIPVETADFWKDITATAALMGMAWYLLRNLVTKQSEAQEKIIETLTAHDTKGRERWVEHDTRSCEQHKALLATAEATGDAMKAVATKINGGN